MAAREARQVWWRRGAAALVAAGLGLVACVTVLPGSAEAAVEHMVVGTDGEGVWLHTVPRIYDGLLVTVPEGTRLSVNCWSYGDDVGGNPIWLHVATDQGVGFLTDAYSDTRWDSTQDLVDQGLPECGTASEEASAAEPSGHGDVPIRYDGDRLTSHEGPLPLSYALFDHYMWGEGRDAVVEASYFEDARGFREHVESMPVGGFGTWAAPDKVSDLYLGVGTFTVSRETDRCWAAYDHYDFSPDKITNALGYWPFYAYQLGGAREFDVHASACF